MIKLDSLCLDSLTSLRDIPGVGQKTAEKLTNFFNGEEKALENVRKGNMMKLLTVPSLSKSDASRIVKNAIVEDYGAESLLKTESLSKIYEKILAKIKENTQTEYGKSLLDLYFPISSRERISEVREWVKESLKLQKNAKIENNLKRVSPINHVDRIRVDDRIILTENLTEMDRIKEKIPGAPVELVDDYRELRKYVDEYETVFVMGEEFVGLDLDMGSIERISGVLEEPIEFFPEIVLDFFTENLETIENAIYVWRKSEAPFLKDIDEEKVEKIEDMLSYIDSEGSITHSEDIQRLSNAIENLEKSVEDARNRANVRFEKLLDDKEITIQGSDLREIVKKGGAADDLISSELEEEFDKIISESVDQIVSKLDLDYEEEAIAQDLFIPELDLPLKIDEEALSRLEDELLRKHSWKSLEKKTEIAREVAELEEVIENLVEKVLELDVALAVKKFTEENIMSLPRLEKGGFELENGRNLFIKNPQPIDYRVEGVRLLTGVNSGGKTSALDLVAQSYILAHMGFPVPAESARLELLDEFYYYRNIKKTMSSGALENILKRFEDLLDSEKSKLVLVDELENITEPGASAKIVSGILDILRRDDDIAVFVSHLADKIKNKAGFEIPVDGIEPKGLDENMDLVVDRTPKRDILATSTPELVVKKLASQRDSSFYDELLEKFENS